MIRNQSQSREREENRGRNCPKHLAGRNPLRHKGDGGAEIKHLFEGKGNGANAKKNAADSTKRSG